MVKDINIKDLYKIESSTLICPPFLNMGIILTSISDLDRAYHELNDSGFSRFILLHAENDNESGPHFNLPYLQNKYPGIIPAFSPIKNEIFENLPHVHNQMKMGQGRGVIYQHTVYKSLHVATAYQLMLKAKDTGALYISFAHNKTLAADGVMHEGQGSFTLGLPGITSLAEEAIVARDIEVARKINCQIHFHQISSRRSIELIASAKKDKVPVSCGINAGHLLYTYEKCSNFNTDFKYLPPLRSEKDRKALIDALKEGIIDTISTGHYPSSKEDTPFIHAPFTSLPPKKIWPLLYREIVQKGIITLDDLLRILIINPRKLLDLPIEDSNRYIKIDLTENENIEKDINSKEKEDQK